MRTIGEIKAALAAHPEWPDDMAVIMECNGETANTSVGSWGVALLDDGDMLHEQALVLTQGDDHYPIAPAP